MSEAKECAGRFGENRVSPETLCCFLENKDLSKSAETLNHVSLEGTNVSKTNNNKDCSARLAERPI